MLNPARQLEVILAHNHCCRERVCVWIHFLCISNLILEVARCLPSPYRCQCLDWVDRRCHVTLVSQVWHRVLGDRSNLLLLALVRPSSQSGHFMIEAWRQMSSEAKTFARGLDFQLKAQPRYGRCHRLAASQDFTSTRPSRPISCSTHPVQVRPCVRCATLASVLHSRFNKIGLGHRRTPGWIPAGGRCVKTRGAAARARLKPRRDRRAPRWGFMFCLIS